MMVQKRNTGHTSDLNLGMSRKALQIPLPDKRSERRGKGERTKKRKHGGDTLDQNPDPIHEQCTMQRGPKHPDPSHMHQRHNPCPEPPTHPSPHHKDNICRSMLSRPGSLVVTDKTGEGTPNGDGERTSEVIEPIEILTEAPLKPAQNFLATIKKTKQGTQWGLIFDEPN